MGSSSSHPTFSDSTPPCVVSVPDGKTAGISAAACRGTDQSSAMLTQSALALACMAPNAVYTCPATFTAPAGYNFAVKADITKGGGIDAGLASTSSYWDLAKGTAIGALKAQPTLAATTKGVAPLPDATYSCAPGDQYSFGTSNFCKSAWTKAAPPK